MALVAYGNSDSSDYEEDDEEGTPVVLLNNKLEESKQGKLSLFNESFIMNNHYLDTVNSCVLTH